MKRKTLWIFMGSSVFIAFLLILLANVLSVGERLIVIHPALAWGFYGLISLAVLFFILNPLRIIFLAPTFSVDALANDDQKYKAYKKAALRVLSLEYLTEAERAVLTQSFGDKAALAEALKATYQGPVQKQLDHLILKHAKTVMTTTAISQNGQLDMFAVVVTNIRMVKGCVEACGYRPSYTHLAKLSLNVALTAMIAEGLEDVNIQEYLPSRFGEAMTDLPMVRTATNSIFQGITNGMLTLRIGIVTRRYLFSDHRLMSTKELRIAAFKESFKLMPLLLKDGALSVPKTIINVMSKPFKRNTNDA